MKGRSTNIAVACMIGLLTLTMTGCSKIDGILENYIARDSGLYEDTNYQTYKAYSSSNKLDENGYYSEEAFVSEQEQ